MDQHDKLINTFHETMVMSLKTTEHYLGRAAAEHLLARVQATFATSAPVPQEPAKDPSITTFDEFMAKGGYSLVGKNMYATVRRGTYPLVAFGIKFANEHTPILNLLLKIDEQSCYEKPVTLSHLGRYSAEHKPLFGDKSGFTFILTNAPSTTNVEQLVKDLSAIDAHELAEAVVRINRHGHGIYDDVPKVQLVPLTDYERDVLPAIPNVEFTYMGQPDELIRIQPVGQEGYAFFSRHQAVEVNPRNVEVSKYLKPGGNTVWDLTVTPHANHSGVSLYAVMSLTEDDPRRAEYLPLIDVFVSQSLEHAQRSPKQQ